jgi:hypothetical protein
MMRINSKVKMQTVKDGTAANELSSVINFDF